MIWVSTLVTLLCWGIWGICDKKAMAGVHPSVPALANSAVAVVVDFAIMRAMGQRFVVPWANFKWVLVAAVCCSLAFLGYLWTLKQSDTGYAVAVTSGYPLVTLVLAYLFLGEALTLQKLAGAALVIAGVIVLSL